ncbi:short-chain dehydrogenase [Bacterioplanes sanyensis]|uniref:Dihydromonapterin reductase n=1 Tax=Bacterioplanes sanyensis TaxID=1249553 RepID=A0A222FQE5_9GAMM|nr:short-chain dehydrogenase [Bacterioplanes sanyensis]
MAKTIVITGAGRRMGKQLAEHFLAQGWQVIAHYNTRSELESHPQLTQLQADLSDPDAIAQLSQQLQSLGPIHAFIHNASCFQPDAAAEDSVEHFQRHFNVHVLAPSELTGSLTWAEGAAMVNISDIYADIPNQRFAVYCASKAALQNWSLSMAQRWAGKVRVNVIQPGPIQFLPEHDEAYRQKVLSQSLIKQELGYQSVIDSADFLISNPSLTGTVMRVDGGRFVTNRYEQTFSNH